MPRLNRSVLNLIQ